MFTVPYEQQPWKSNNLLNVYSGHCPISLSKNNSRRTISHPAGAQLAFTPYAVPWTQTVPVRLAGTSVLTS